MLPNGCWQRMIPHPGTSAFSPSNLLMDFRTGTTWMRCAICFLTLGRFGENTPIWPTERNGAVEARYPGD